jgi:holo-[acyl-carrier protein] synthase
MAVIGIGLDVVDIPRFAGVYERFGGKLLRRVFTETERAYCGKRIEPINCYAGRFAAKEAIFKAIGGGTGLPIPLRDVEIAMDGRRPTARLRGTAERLARERGITEVLVTISHDAGVAAAAAVAVDGK